jgi:hypothetical protein
MAIAIGGSYIPTSGGSNPMVLPIRRQVACSASDAAAICRIAAVSAVRRMALQQQPALVPLIGKRINQKKQNFPKTIQIFVVPSKNDNHIFALPLVAYQKRVKKH